MHSVASKEHIKAKSSTMVKLSAYSSSHTQLTQNTV